MQLPGQELLTRRGRASRLRVSAYASLGQPDNVSVSSMMYN